jgi:hypothetical protein
MEDTLNRPTSFGGTKLILGIFFVIHGLLLAADNLGALVAGDYLRYWPAVILLVGIYKIWEPGRQLAGGILIAIGAAMLAATAGWIRFSLFDLWPLLLIAAGVLIVARATGVQVGTGGDDGQTIAAVMTNRKVSPREFAGARAVAVMGSLELDLTGATLTESPAVIEAFTMWGGIEIYVPDTWEIIGEVVPVMGGFEVLFAPVGTPQRQLIVRGAAIMAGIAVNRRKS